MGTATCYVYGQGRTTFVPIRSTEYLLKFEITTGVTAAQSPAMPNSTEYVIIEPSVECHIVKDAAESTADAVANDPTVYVGQPGNEFLIGPGEFFSLIE